MTPRRAVTAHRPQHASPARVHFAYVEIGGDSYYVGIGTVQQRPESLDTHRKGNQQSVIGTAQDVLGRPEHTGLPGEGSQDTGRMGRTDERAPDCRRNAVISVTPASELKLLPAPPQVAGLLPARVPVPQTNGKTYVRIAGVGVGYLTPHTDRGYQQIALIGLSQSAVVWKRSDQYTVCSKPDGRPPIEISPPLNSVKAKVSMRG